MARQTKLMTAGHSALAAQSVVGEAQSLALAGSSATDATKITGECVIIASGSGGLILPVSNKGDTYLIKNESGNTATLYPPTGATINTAASLSVATAKSVLVFFTSATACHTIPTVAS